MKHLRRTTSLTGSPKAFTFVEVMVTLVILSSGIVMIYKSFFLCVDYLSRLSCRLCAVELLDEKIADMSRLLKETAGTAFDREPLTVTRQIQHKAIDYHYEITFDPVAELEGVYRLDVGLSWSEGDRAMHLSRSAFVTQ